MSLGMIDYLLAACEEIQGDIEQQVDAVVLRKKHHYRLDFDRNCQRGLEYRGYITTKGAGKVPIGFFWVTEEGVRAAINEGELSGAAKFFREGWEENVSGIGLERRIRWCISDEFQKIPDPQRTPLESETLFEILSAEGWEIPPGELDKVLESLEERGFIRSFTVSEKDAITKHGGRRIWAVNDERFLG